jgi:hypothetical protein
MLPGSFPILRRLFAAKLLLAAFLSVQAAQAQSLFVYDELEGGLIDTTTGLVWVDVSNFTTATYDYAVNILPDRYAESEWGLPWTNWRTPTKAEMLDSQSKGLYEAMIAAGMAAYPAGHWAADAPFKLRGKWHAYQVNIQTGEVRTSKTNQVAYVMLVREVQD